MDNIRVELIKFGIDRTSPSYSTPPNINEIFRYNITDYVLDGTLKGDFRTEFNRPYDLGVSNASLELDKKINEIVLIDLNTIPSPGYSFIEWGLRIVTNTQNEIYNIPGTGDFLGILDRDNSYYDPVREVWILNFNDILKTLFDMWEFGTLQNLPSWDTIEYPLGYPTVGYTLPRWLDRYNRISMVGVPRDTDYIINSSVMFRHETYIKLTNRKQTANGFLTELLKHYGALIYINGDGKIIFRNRNLVANLPTNIDDIVLEEGYSAKFASLQIYDSVLVTSLINASERIHDGALLLYYSNGLPVYQFVYIWGLYWSGEYSTGEGPVDPITGEPWNEDSLAGWKYLDIREYFVDIDDNVTPFDYSYRPIPLFYPSRTKADYLNDYYDLMNPRPPYLCKVDSVDINLLQKVRLNNNNYVVHAVIKDYDKKESSLELTQVA